MYVAVAIMPPSYISDALAVSSADTSISDDGKLLAVSNVVTGFDIYCADTGEAVCSVGHTVQELRKVPVLFIHGGLALLGGNPRGDVHLWDMSSGCKQHSLVHRGASLLGIIFKPRC